MSGSRIDLGSSQMRQLISTLKTKSNSRGGSLSGSLQSLSGLAQNIFKPPHIRLQAVSKMPFSFVDAYRQKVLLEKAEGAWRPLLKEIKEWKGEVEGAPFFDSDLDRFVETGIKAIGDEILYLESENEFKRNRAFKEIDKTFDNMINRIETLELRKGESHEWSASLYKMRKNIVESMSGKLKSHKDETIAQSIATARTDEKLSRLGHAINELYETEKSFNRQLCSLENEFKRSGGRRNDAVDEAFFVVGQMRAASDNFIEKLESVKERKTVDEQLTTFLNHVTTEDVEAVMKEQRFGAVWFGQSFRPNQSRFERFAAKQARANQKLSKADSVKYGRNLESRAAPVFQRGPRYQLLLGEMAKASDLMTPKARGQLDHLYTVVKLENTTTLLAL